MRGLLGSVRGLLPARPAELAASRGTSGMRNARDAQFRGAKTLVQTISATTETVLTWSDAVGEGFDIGSRFASNAWTPFAGPIQIGFDLIITSLVADCEVGAIIKRNGTYYLGGSGAILSATSIGYSADDTDTVYLAPIHASLPDNPDGADVYTVTVYSTSICKVRPYAPEVSFGPAALPASNFWGYMTG